MQTEQTASGWRPLSQRAKTLAWFALLAGVVTLLTLLLTELSYGGETSAPSDNRMSPAVAIHLATVIPALPLGALLLVRRKGDRPHRMLGATWMALMMITAISTLWLRDADGGFSFIHIFTLITFISIPRALIAIRRGNVQAHRIALTASYIGLVIAGVFAFIPGRLLGNAVCG